MTWNGMRALSRPAIVFMALFSSFAGMAEPGRPGRESAPFELRMLSYNIQGMPLPGMDHTRYRKIGVYLRMLRESGRGYHVVVLQEAFHKRTEELIEEAAYPYRSDGPGRKGLRVNAGLVILSEYPIVDEERMVFRFCAGTDCLSRKGVQLARVDLPEIGRIDIYNTHMNASYSDGQWPPGQFGEIVRVRQLTQMRDFLFRTMSRDTPTFFGGDFNFRPGSPSYALFGKFSTLSDAAEECVHASCPGEENPQSEWLGAIDHQFYSPSLPGMHVSPVYFARNFRELIGGKPLSDHLGHEIHYLIER